MNPAVTLKKRPPVAVPPDNLFSGSRWVATIADFYGLDVCWASTPHWTWPLARVDDPGGKRIVAFPFSDYLPVPTSVEGARAQVRSTVEQLRNAYPDHRLELKVALSAGQLPPGGRVTRRAVYHRCLPGQRPTPSFLRAVRKAERSGLIVRRATDGAAADRFYALYLRQRLDKFASIPQPRGFFQHVARTFFPGGHGFFLEACQNEEVVASALFLREGRGLFYKFGTSTPAALALRPNNLLFAQALELVSAEGFAFLDLGLSGTTAKYAGLRRFKASAGGREHPITYVSYYPEGYDEVAGIRFREHLGELTRTIVSLRPEANVIDALSAKIYPFFA